MPLTAVALSTIVIGFTAVALANTRPGISPEACDVLLRTGMENTATLLEELGLRNPAVYLPAALRDGHQQAVVPLGDAGNTPQIKDKLTGRLILRYGPRPGDMGIAVATPGSLSIEMLESTPGPTSEEIGAAITYIMNGLLDIASSVEVSLSEAEVNIQVNGSRWPHEDIWYYRCLGSPLASIAAAVSSEALGKPARIKKEEHRKGKDFITIEVLP